MNLIRLCLERPVSVSVGVLLMTLFGLLSLFAIPVQLTPDVDTPIVTVNTNWRGATPQDVEREIVDRQEEMLRNVRGLREMTSTSRDNAASITLEFYPSVDKDTAMREVSDKLRQVTGYPLEVDEPTAQAADGAVDSPIAWLVLYGKDNSDEVRKLRDFAEDFIQPYLDRVPGVAGVEVYGGMEREIQVNVRAGELAARGLTLSQVRDALQRQNEDISAGARTQGKLDFTVRTVGQFDSIDQVLNTVVTYTAGGPVYVRDIADVRQDYARPLTFVRNRGEFVLGFPVRRETGSNVIRVMEGVRQAVKRVNEEVLAARGMHLDLTQVYDETTYIHQSIAMVQSNIVYGGGLAIAVLMMFLRNWRATLIVSLSIPVSVIGTFVVVVALGRTLNVISLAGMAFAVGMVVDNAIVVLENIYRRRQMGKDGFSAAYDGAREVWGAVLASTLTTMAVFIPVIFVEEEAGQLFRDISVATATAVGLSLIVSLTVIPPLAARLFRRAVRGPAALLPDEGTGRFAHFVASIVDRVNSSVGARLAIVILLGGGSLLASRYLIPPATYLPSGNRNLVIGSLLTPPGYSLEEYQRMASIIEERLRPYWEAKEGSPEHKALDEAWVKEVEQLIAANAIPELVDSPQNTLSWLERDRARREWLTPPPLIDNFFFVTFEGTCFMGASSRDPARVKPLKRLFETAGQRIPGVFAFFFQTSLFQFGSGNTADIQIRGDDLDKVIQAASAMQMECMGRFGNPQPSPANFNLGRPELRVTPDRERAADLGMSVTDVGLIVEACVDGAYVGDYRVSGGDTIDISLYIADQQDKPTQMIGHTPVYTPAGSVVPLSALVQMTDTDAQEQIKHVERQRAVTLTISPPESMALETVIDSIKNPETGIERKLREAGAIDPSVLVSMTGNADKLTAARNTMVGEWRGFTLESLVNLIGSRFFLSVLIVYLLMCSLYESWLYPFVIMFSVPLAIFGGFLGLSLAHWGTLLTTDQPVQQLDVLTFLGFIILVGTVVNNAILLVDQTLIGVREQGMSPSHAISHAVRIRVRPVLMTSMTTIFGQLPLAVMPGAGSELYRGLAAVMVGGMLVATIGTLVLVPAALSLTMDARRKWAEAPSGATLAPSARDR